MPIPPPGPISAPVRARAEWAAPRSPKRAGGAERRSSAARAAAPRPRVPGPFLVARARDGARPCGLVPPHRRRDIGDVEGFSGEARLEPLAMTLAVAAGSAAPAAALAFPAMLDARDGPGHALSEESEQRSGKADRDKPEPWVEKRVLPWCRMQEFLKNGVIRPCQRGDEPGTKDNSLPPHPHLAGDGGPALRAGLFIAPTGPPTSNCVPRARGRDSSLRPGTSAGALSCPGRKPASTMARALHPVYVRFFSRFRRRGASARIIFHRADAHAAPASYI